MQQLGGAPTPAVGWAAGVERMLMSAGELPIAPHPVDLFVARAGSDAGAAGFALAAEARRAGLSAQVELSGRSLKGQLKHADRIGARYVAIVGDEATASLRDMETGRQDEIERAAVIPTILRGSRLS
jgi:histidyl-tRNA synthetase